MSLTDRSWFRRTVMFAAAAVVLALVVLTVSRVAGPRATGTAEAAASARAPVMARFEEPAIPDQDNAARWLEAGAAAIVWSEADSDAVGAASTTPFTGWGPELEGEVRAALHRHAGALATLHQAVGAPAAGFGLRYSEGMDLEPPELLPLLRAARLLVVEARMAFADGDEGQGVLALATLHRTATALEQERTLITALVGIAVDRMLQVVAAEAVSADRPWASQEPFLAQVETITAGFGTRRMLERVTEAWSTLFCFYLGSDARSFTLASGESVDFASGCGCADIEGAAFRVMDLVDRPYGTATTAFDDLATDTACGEGTLGDLEGFSKAVARAQAVDAQRQLVEALVALRRLGRESGAYPSERPDIEPLTRPDPFTGRPLIYVFNADGTVTLDLDGAGELLEPITVSRMREIVAPVTLPAPVG